MKSIDWPVIDEFVVQRVARQSFHDVALGSLVGQRDGRHHVGAEVDTENRDGAERQRHVGDDEEQERRDLRDVARQRVRDRLLQVIEDQPTWQQHTSANTTSTTSTTSITTPYLAESVRRTADVEGRRHLRSSTTMTLVVPSVQRSTLGDRAFPVAASWAWNSLPPAIRTVSSFTSFRQQLKTSV